MSRPARGGWIEIMHHRFYRCLDLRPAPHGAGGLKCDSVYAQYIWAIVPPRTGRVD